jgi:hypothetical protein
MIVRCPSLTTIRRQVGGVAYCRDPDDLAWPVPRFASAFSTTKARSHEGDLNALNASWYKTEARIAPVVGIPHQT